MPDRNPDRPALEHAESDDLARIVARAATFYGIEPFSDDYDRFAVSIGNDVAYRRANNLPLPTGYVAGRADRCICSDPWADHVTACLRPGCECHFTPAAFDGLDRLREGARLVEIEEAARDAVSNAFSAKTMNTLTTALQKGETT